MPVHTVTASNTRLSCKLFPCGPVWGQHAGAGTAPAGLGGGRSPAWTSQSRAHWLILTCSDVSPKACFLSRDGLSSPGFQPHLSFSQNQPQHETFLRSPDRPPSHRSSLWGPLMSFSATVVGAISVYLRGFRLSMDMMLNLGLCSRVITKP